MLDRLDDRFVEDRRSLRSGFLRSLAKFPDRPGDPPEGRLAELPPAVRPGGGDRGDAAAGAPGRVDAAADGHLRASLVHGVRRHPGGAAARARLRAAEPDLPGRPLARDAGAQRGAGAGGGAGCARAAGRAAGRRGGQTRWWWWCPRRTTPDGRRSLRWRRSIPTHKFVGPPALASAERAAAQRRRSRRRRLPAVHLGQHRPAQGRDGRPPQRRAVHGRHGGTLRRRPRTIASARPST